MKNYIKVINDIIKKNGILIDFCGFLCYNLRVMSHKLGSCLCHAENGSHSVDCFQIIRRQYL